MASVADCRTALDSLAAALAGVSPELRRKHVPSRGLACQVRDLDVVFVGRIDEHGLHDIHLADDDADQPVVQEPDVKVVLSSDELVALAAGEQDFLHAWLRGRVQVSAPVRDLLRLRSLLGL